MLQVQYFDPSHLNESQIYEDLSQIIKAFKNLLISFDHIANNLHKFLNTSQALEQLKQTLKTLQGFVKVYSYSITQQSQHKQQQIIQYSTFHRFICRLIESISAYKLKLQNLQYSNILNGQIKQIEQVILQYQQDKNIGLIIKKIYIVANRFCYKTIKNLQNNTKLTQNDQVFSSDKQTQFTTISHQYQSNKDRNTNFTLIINEIKPKKILQSKSQNSLNKVMNLLNRKYRTLACLDIDYQQFKQLFFSSRDSKDDLYEDCFERNSFIHKQILRYSKQFSDYLQKREMKIFRKNKFADSLAQNNIKVKNKINLSKIQQSQHSNYNFTKKKIVNQFKKAPENSLLSNQIIQNNSPYLMVRSQIVDEKFLNLNLTQNSETAYITPQLNEERKKPNILPLMITSHHFSNEKEKFQDFTNQNFLQISKRKKNLHLKKIDISLTSFSNGGQVQSAKAKNKLINPDTFKKTNSQTTKQMQQKINASIRKNYLHKKYEQAMKKNFGDSLNQIDDEQSRSRIPFKFSSSNCIQIEQQTPTQISRQRKYLIKTSNKRPILPGTQYKSLNPVNQRKQATTIKNFRKLKMDQVQKIQRLQKMKETALNHMQLLSGGKAIRPTLNFRQRQLVPNMYTEIREQDFCDINLGSHKQFLVQQRFL